MDPLTITTGVLSAVASGIKAFQLYQSYAAKYNLADLTIISIRTECSTIRLALSRIHTIIAENETLRVVSNVDEAADEMWEEYGVVLGACTLTFNVLNERLSNMGLDKVDEHNLMATKSKIKAMMNSDEMVCLIQNIRGQAQALGLLLQIFQAATTSKTYQLLREERNSVIFKTVSDNTQSLVGNLRQSRSLDSRFSLHSSLLGDEEFDFDDVIVNSKSYRRLLMQNRGHRRRTPMEECEVSKMDIVESQVSPNTMLSQHPDLSARVNELDHQQTDTATTSQSHVEMITDHLATNTSDIASNKTAVLVDLKNRVDDWKGHIVDGFGELLLWGEYKIVTDREESKLFSVYLFEFIILCCKKVRPQKKSRTKLRKLFNRPKLPEPGERNTKLQLKGRIFMSDVNECIPMYTFGERGTVQIWWKGSSGIQSFGIILNRLSEARTWFRELEKRRKLAPQNMRTNQEQQTELAWIDKNDNDSDNDHSDEVDSEPEQLTDTTESEALKLFQFHVMPTVEPRIPPRLV